LCVIDRHEVLTRLAADPHRTLLQVREQARKHHRTRLIVQLRPLLRPDENCPVSVRAIVVCVSNDDVEIEVGLKIRHVAGPHHRKKSLTNCIGPLRRLAAAIGSDDHGRSCYKDVGDRERIPASKCETASPRSSDNDLRPAAFLEPADHSEAIAAGHRETSATREPRIVSTSFSDTA
jgi:hypothetical protein